MTTLNLKLTHKPVKAYYESLQRFESIGVSHETAVRSAFQTLLEHCGRQFNWILVPEHSMTPLIRGARRVKNKRIVVDGALIDSFQLPHGYWEAKDIHDDLPAEVLRKFEKGYPRDNILFQTPHRALLWQNNQQTLDADLTDPTQLIHTLETFCSHRPQELPNGRRRSRSSKTEYPHLERVWQN